MSGDVKAFLSQLEKGYVELLQGDGLDLPVTNRPAGAHYVDCRWPKHKLTVELDSYRYHNSRHSWTQDRRREREARARGDEFRRYIWEDVFETADLTLREMRQLLGAGC
jgi:very-short-patch-repair endonuclease